MKGARKRGGAGNGGGKMHGAKRLSSEHTEGIIINNTTTTTTTISASTTPTATTTTTPTATPNTTIPQKKVQPPSFIDLSFNLSSSTSPLLTNKRLSPSMMMPSSASITTHPSSSPLSSPPLMHYHATLSTITPSGTTTTTTTTSRSSTSSSSSSSSGHGKLNTTLSSSTWHALVRFLMFSPSTAVKSVPWSSDPLYMAAFIVAVLPIRALAITCPSLIAAVITASFAPAYRLPYVLDAIDSLPSSVRSFILIFCSIETLWTLVHLYLFHASTVLQGCPPPYTSTSHLAPRKKKSHPSLTSSSTTMSHPKLPAIHLARTSHLSAMDLFKRVLAEVDDFGPFLRDWFMGTPVKEIGLDDLKTWLAWAFFAKELSQVDLSQKVDLEVMAEDIQTSLGFRMKSGSTGAKCLRHTLDPFESQHRPFICYAVTMGMDFTSSSILSLSTFTKKTTPDNLHTYWVSPPRPRSTPLPARDPIIFVHGIGVGIAVYLPFILNLRAQFPDRLLILFELRHVSMQLSGHVPTMEQTLKGIEDVYKDLGVKKAVWVGHSLGSVVCSWVCRERGEWMSGVVFVDPVVFGLWNHHVAYNFLYKAPKGGLDLLIWYFVSQEMHISLSLRRHFWWYRAVLFPEYLPLLKPTSPPPSPSRSTKLLQTAIGPLSHPRPRTATDTPFATTVFLSEKDQIVPFSEVEKHLAFHHVRTVTWRGFTHGQMCVTKEVWGEVCEEIGRM